MKAMRRNAITTLMVNKREYVLEVDEDMPLLWAIRDFAGLTGTKYGCGQGLCGACTVYVDGEPVRSCQTAVGDVVGNAITTVEGLSGKIAETVQAVWTEMDVPQCGYCQSGQIMSAVALLGVIRKPSNEDIDRAMNGNLCRCASYHRIRAAIHEASRRMEA
jgi:isoquinoline 1-oxidoreductase alpha subunit